MTNSGPDKTDKNTPACKADVIAHSGIWSSSQGRPHNEEGERVEDWGKEQLVRIPVWASNSNIFLEWKDIVIDSLCFHEKQNEGSVLLKLTLFRLSKTE